MTPALTLRYGASRAAAGTSGDIPAAARGALNAPVSGRVAEASTLDRWDAATNKGADRGGLAVSIIGDDVVRYYGSRLSTTGVRPGTRVLAGITRPCRQYPDPPAASHRTALRNLLADSPRISWIRW